jgi:hypothetical protein
VERRGRQHEAERPQAGSDCFGKPRGAVGTQQDNWRWHTRQLALFLGDDRAIAPNDCKVACHECKRLGVASLGAAQARNRVGIGGVACQVIATEALDRDNLSAADQADSGLDGVGFRGNRGCRVIERDQCHGGAAGRARDRFGMEAAVVRIAIFGAASVAQRKSRHRSRRPVVGDRGDDAQARAAMRAIGERITKSPAARIAQLGDARRTDRGIGSDLRMGAAACALGDTKFARQIAGILPSLDAVDPGQPWQLAFDAVEQGVYATLIATHAQQYTIAVIEDFAGQPQRASDAPHGWAKADALHAATYAEFERLRLLRRDHVTTGLLPELHVSDLDIAIQVLRIHQQPEHDDNGNHGSENGPSAHDLAPSSIDWSGFG